ncbi:hypothetical protein KBD75_02035 [Candidatus Woesebacteria bacterium]|nr:hypothetical protein [Candidatus Woesebacteria bacterium]
MKVNELNYPIEYFEAQVRFASKWATVTQTYLTDSLSEKTALVRRFDDPETFSRIANQNTDERQLTRLLYASYETQPSAKYVPKLHPRDATHYGVYGYKYFPENKSEDGLNTIKMHVYPSPRGESSNLTASAYENSVDDLRQMTSYIHDNLPDAQIVVGGSWLYNVPGYRDPFPPEFINNLKRMVPPGIEIPGTVPKMSFTGDSLWGQFITRNGFIKPQVFVPFITDVERAKNVTDLLDAFPYKPLHSATPIRHFYEHFKI